MHIKELRDRRDELENDIASLLMAFTEETGVHVERIDVHTLLKYREDIPTYQVIATARLKIDL